MIIIELDFESYLTGIFSIIISIIFFIVGLIISLKFIKYKNKNLLLVGVSWIALSTPWMAVSVHFLMLIFTNTSLKEEVFFFLCIGFLPIAQVCWIWAITNLVFFKNQLKKRLQVISLILMVFIEVIVIYMLFTDVSLIGTIEGTMLVKFTLITSIYLTFMVVIWEIAGIILVRESLKSDNPETRLKGKVLSLGLICFLFGSITETLIMQISITVIGRIILIFSAFAFYCGFMLPQWIKKLIIKEK